MPHLFSYRDTELYSHHTIDPVPDPDSYSMHAHEMMEIYYFISGKGSYLVEGSQYPLQPGDIMILRVAETHRLTISPDEPYERIAIHFSPSLFSSIDPEQQLLRPFLDRPLGQMNLYSHTDKNCAHLQTAFSDFSFDELPDPRLNIIGRLLMFLTALNAVYDMQRNIRSPVQGLQSQLVKYVNENLFAPISLQSVADHFYRSRSQIGRIFHQATGSSLWEYVSIKRMLAARAMIQRGEAAGIAAITCGFSDYSAFYRAYKNYYGHAPTDDAP